MSIAIHLTLSGCGMQAPGSDGVFQDAPTITLGAAQPTTVANVAGLGTLEADEAVSITVTSEAARFVLVVKAENERNDTAVIVGGGRVGETFTHRVREPGTFFVFVVYAPDATPGAQTASVVVGRAASPSVETPSRQLVVVDFETDFLTEPGLWDPVDGTTEDKAFLNSIESTVQAEVIRSLQNIFDGTPVEIVEEPPALTDEPFSRITFSPQRVLASADDTSDAALPPPDPTRPQCQVRVVFGEVLPRGTNIDPGNRVRDDAAVVYVGSFQGRGQECWTSAIGSLNNVVLTLTQTAAHEIGHLVGLFHVEQIDIMNRSATLAFLRNLEFARGQVQLDRLIGGQVVSEVFPSIIQEPQRYFDTIFAP